MNRYRSLGAIAAPVGKKMSSGRGRTSSEFAVQAPRASARDSARTGRNMGRGLDPEQGRGVAPGLGVFGVVDVTVLTIPRGGRPGRRRPGRSAPGTASRTRSR